MKFADAAGDRDRPLEVRRVAHERGHGILRRLGQHAPPRMLDAEIVECQLHAIGRQDERDPGGRAAGIHDPVVDAARGANRLGPLPPRGEPAGGSAVGVVDLGLGGRVGPRLRYERQPAAGHAAGAAQSARVAAEISRVSRRSSSVVGRPQNQ